MKIAIVTGGLEGVRQQLKAWNREEELNKKRGKLDKLRKEVRDLEQEIGK